MAATNLDGFTLADDEVGGGFVLAGDSPISTVIRLDDWTVELLRGSRYVIAHGGQATGYEDVRQQVLTYIQHGLDYISIRGQADLRTQDVADEHIVWWPEQEGLRLRICATALVRASFGATATVANQAGEVVPPPASPPIWHQSMRLWRQGQLADDVFEALRSLWLAVENLLDDLAPYTSGEGEANWVKRAFSQAGQHIDLTNYLPPTQRALPDEAYDYFYNSLRNYLFHAKGSRSTWLPQEPGHTLSERHERLTRLYLDLLNSRHGVLRGGGVLTYQGFDLMMRPLQRGCSVLTTNDATDPSGQQDWTTISPSGGTVVAASAQLEQHLTRLDAFIWLGSIPGDQARQMQPEPVFRVGLEHQGNLVAISELEGFLEVGNLAWLDVQHGLRLANVQQPKVFLDA